MTHDGNGLTRMTAVAALLSLDQAASAITGAWTTLSGRQFSASEATLIDWATDEEWDIAAAIRGARGDLSELDAEAVAGLLRLAAGTADAAMLLTGLRQHFIDDEPDDRGAAFAQLFERVVMPSLRGAEQQAGRSLLRTLTATSRLTRL
jgi:hypothetical protein